MVVDKSCTEVKIFDGRREDVGEAANARLSEKSGRHDYRKRATGT